MRLCRYLRWKSWYTASFPDDASIRAAFELNDAQYSCLKTCQPWGPDDHASVPENCQPGRGCFVLSPKDPTSRRVS
ncbi:MAG: hypothetical protein R3F61_16970 [Myxococcota bacterium]